jgi:hypothetical protein
MQISRSLALATFLAASVEATASDLGGLAGRVLPAAGQGFSAKTVWIGSIPAAVGADGTFRADRIPEGPAKLAIETSEGIYLVATPVVISPGTTHRVQLAIGGRQDTSPPQPAGKQKKKKGGPWDNPASATLIVVGSAIVVGFAVDQLSKSDPRPVSPSAPTN